MEGVSIFKKPHNNGSWRLSRRSGDPKTTMIKISSYKPAVTNHLLLFLAGLAWILVGIMLLFLAFSWLWAASHINIWLFTFSGVISALGVHYLGFSKIAHNNLQRILSMGQRSCLFAFFPWKSYLIIAVMIAMGAILRHSTIPKHFLAVLYIAIGLALVLSSFKYFSAFVQEIRR